MKVILRADVEKLGHLGDIVNVKPGYGRNYLLPRKLAVPATADAMNTMRLQEKAKKAEMERQKAAAQAAAEQLKGAVVKIAAKAGGNGKLFGAVTAKEISDALMSQHGIELAKNKIVMEEPIKSFGTYELKAKLGFEISGTVYVVVSEEK